VNTASAPPRVLRRYTDEGAFPVEADLEAIQSLGIQTIARSLASTRHLMRHDATVLAEAILEWLDAQADLVPGTMDTDPKRSGPRIDSVVHGEAPSCRRSPPGRLRC
jgi:hypothetical protein